MLSRQASTGFTLVEVMVTVFVVAIGLLTAAGLQAVSKKAAFDALQRTTASVIAQDMLERIRANPTMQENYVLLGAEVKGPISGVTCGGGTACSKLELVSYDLSRWWMSLDGAAETISSGATTANAGGLRSPVGCISQSGLVVNVVVAWRGLSAIRQASDGDDDPTSDTCGEGQSPDPYEKTGTQSYRRVLRLQAHIR